MTHAVRIVLYVRNSAGNVYLSKHEEVKRHSSDRMGSVPSPHRCRM